MPHVTRTTGPLHFEDLEPKRFEDLARQLIYDFRDWYKLEAVGRTGNDDGFDARALEAESPAEEDDLPNGHHRTWLIQCKREKTVTPKKLLGYLRGIAESAGEPLYGLMFVAACDFSKKARDTFNIACREMGLLEWFLLGKAEMEDLLFRPKYDHLLYGYFGISLGHMHGNAYAQLRRSLAVKRKTVRLLKDSKRKPVLIRLVDTKEYPYPADEEKFKSEPEWIVREYLRHTHSGIVFLYEKHFAYLDEDCGRWDAAFAVNDAVLTHEDYWLDTQEHAPQRHAVFEAWSLLESNRAWLTVEAEIPYERIVEVDEHGDEFAAFPQVLIERGAKHSFFSGFRANVATIDGSGRNRSLASPTEDRSIVFPEEMRKGRKG